MIIKTENLIKEYKYFEKPEDLKASVKSLFKRETKLRRALDDFAFSVDEGEFVGLMGPNGAGKTTLIKLLTGIIRPSSGEISVLGYEPARGDAAFKKKFAVVMGQKSQLWWDLPASDSLLLNKAIYEIPERQYRDNVAYFTKLFEVERYLNVPVRKLSLGERMKFELIASLLHAPKLLFLDEPTIGLDAMAQRQIRAMLKAAGRERGVTLLLTSHYTEDLLELTPRCVVIRGGKKIYDGEINTLLQQYSVNHTITVKFATETKLPELYGAEIIEQTPFSVEIRTPKENVRNCLSKLMELVDIEDIQIADDDVTLLVERVFKTHEN
jgi:ABC-2 type transport system ATP-binding protein